MSRRRNIGNLLHPNGWRQTLAQFTGDQVRIGEHSRAGLSLSDGTIVGLNELTTARLGVPERRGILELFRGVMSFFHRDEPGSLEVRSGGVSAMVKGTEFVMAARPDNSVLLTLLEGNVILTNTLGAPDSEKGQKIGGLNASDALAES